MESSPVPQASIRPYQPDDRSAIRRICYDTALMGKSIVDQYRDFESLADILSAYYTDFEPENALVAERDGQVIGYLLSCLDTRRAHAPSRFAFRHILWRGVCFRPGTARFYLRALRDMAADMATRGRPKIDLDRYPSHTHSNFIPDARGAGVGTELFYRLFDQLKAQGSTGMHAEVMAENLPTLRWAQTKLGYHLHGDPYYVPGMRGPDGKRLRIQMLKRELSDWEPGAWKQHK